MEAIFLNWLKCYDMSDIALAIKVCAFQPKFKRVGWLSRILTFSFVSAVRLHCAEEWGARPVQSEPERNEKGVWEKKATARTRAIRRLMCSARVNQSFFKCSCHADFWRPFQCIGYDCISENTNVFLDVKKLFIAIINTGPSLRICTLNVSISTSSWK